jgi:hypothetical protein
MPGKDPWAHGAISTAEWRGARVAAFFEIAAQDRGAITGGLKPVNGTPIDPH